MAETCHEKGCNKIRSFNKPRKTSAKFCAEHKKDGMVSVIYRYYNNQVDQIFKDLPRDLQWEILTDFVGGYVVRYNRLKRLFSGELQQKIVAHNFDINCMTWRRLWLKPFIRLASDDYDHLTQLIINRWKVTSFRADGTIWDDYDPDKEHDPDLLKRVAVAEFSLRRTCVVLFESKSTGQLSYGFHMDHNPQWYITDIDDSVTLPPYEKHVYPSYPYTNKKLKRPLLKMKLHNPIGKVPEYLGYNQEKAWYEGRYISFHTQKNI
jgi:hypothetical protein